MDIKKLIEVNKMLRTTDIKGKGYIEVNERIKAFWELFPNGRLASEIVSIENGVCIIRAYAYENKEDEKPLSIGTAYEKENSTFINKTSYIENCETSAYGRCLGLLGIGIDTSVASAEEVGNAMSQQEDMRPINRQELSVLQALIKTLPEAKAFYDNVLKRYNITDLSQLTAKQDGEILTEIKELKGE